MQKIFTFLLTLAFTIGAFPQVPERISYQDVMRNSSGVLKANQAIGMKISILQGSATGMSVLYFITAIGSVSFRKKLSMRTGLSVRTLLS